MTESAHSDRAAIFLSGLCLLHCLALPLAVALLPWLSWGADSTIHRALLLVIVPVSLYALSRGCRQHRDVRVLLCGFGALALLSASAFSELWLPPSVWLETLFTVLASAGLVTAHVLNLRQLRASVPA